MSLHLFKNWDLVSSYCTEGNWAHVFHETIKFELYMKLILSSFLDQLTDEEKTYRHFIQENAKAHTVKNSRNALYEVFSD